MANIGFTYYDTIPVQPQPTTAEIVAALSGQEKIDVLNGFIKKIIPNRLKYSTTVPEGVIKHLYRKIDEIEERARALMRGEVLITPAVIDPNTGEVTTSAVYNTPPETSGALLSQVQDDFDDDFTAGQVTDILTKMVEYSKHDGSGNWTFYKAEVIK